MPSLSFNYLISSTARTLYARNGCYTSDNFQEIHIDLDLTLPLCASLNSSLFQLMVNMAGRSNFGGGLLKIQTYEVSELLCLDPKPLHLRTKLYSHQLPGKCWNPRMTVGPLTQSFLMLSVSRKANGMVCMKLLSVW